MIIAISGCRNYNNYNTIKEYLDNNIKNIDNLIIHVGDAKGVDKLVIQYCKNNNIEYKIFYANWNKYGKPAGPIRNIEMIKNSQKLIAFPSEESKGTISSINIAKNLEIEYLIFNI